MNAQGPLSISSYAKTLDELKKLSVEIQAVLLLKRLKNIYYDHKVQPERFCKANILNRAAGRPDPYGLAAGFPEDELWSVVEHLLGKPWFTLEQNYDIGSNTGDQWYDLTPQGLERANSEVGSTPPDRAVIEPLKLLHPDLRGYGHYFYENKLKDAVSAAYRRVENRFNEIRDGSGNASVSGFSGAVLPRKLIDLGVLKFPYAQLANGNPTSREAYIAELKNFLSSGIGWFRNSFQHEPHNLPELSESEVLEYLFVASHMLNTIDRMV